MSNENVKKKLLHRAKAVNAWDTAIRDAERMIEQEKQQIGRLKRAIDAFKDLRESGEPFPGEECELIKAGLRP